MTLHSLALILAVSLLCVSCLSNTPHTVNLTVTQLNTEVSLAPLMGGDIRRAVEQSSDVVWKSNDAKLATVDDQGLLTAHGVGNVTLSASFGALRNLVFVRITESGEVIHGRLQYEDKKYNALGFVASSTPEYNDIRYVTVDLLSSAGAILETTSSDGSGRFAFGHIIPDKYSIRALAEVAGAPAVGFSVKSGLSRSTSVYAVNQISIEGQTAYDIQLSQQSPVAAAFNMLDVFISAAEFSKKFFNVDVEGLTVYWSTNSAGSYYCSGGVSSSCRYGAGIYVFNSREDADQYDDDVLLHEFGHFLITEYFVDDSPGGCHSVTDSDQDVRLAWSEGWATFFGSAVKQDIPLAMRSSLAPFTSYVDTDGERLALISYDALSPESTYPEEESVDSYQYATSEVAVNHILWSIHATYGVGIISDVLTNHFPTAALPTSLSSFWQGLMASELHLSGEADELTDIFSRRRVSYLEDAFESDDVLANATAVLNIDISAVPSEPKSFERYLYKDDLSDDVDLFSINVEKGASYTIETTELRNGIDTYLRMLDEAGEEIILNNAPLVNDDALMGEHYRYSNWCNGYRHFNSTRALASKVTFVATETARYYVEVSHMSSNNKASIGEDALGATSPYGGYRLMIEAEKAEIDQIL